MTGKDTASFFENATTEQFEYCYKLYPQVLKMKAEKKGKKPQELIRLDEWYQNELPKLIKARGKDAHIEYDELVQTMKWKQSRGKFYPQLSYLVKVNTPRAVATETKKAFRKLPNLEQAITALSNLKGVGTTMASALLAAAAPDKAPFMADECLMAIPEIEGIDYTTKEYLNFVQHIQATVARLNSQIVGSEKAVWSPHRVELALWAHYVANDLSPELLDQMPGPGAGGGILKTNGTINKANIIDEGSEDNTNDIDDESLSAVRRSLNATESETDNENTNPGIVGNNTMNASVVDGDSNFVSNDSMSQEPLIDENTTQTTATTSTDDGEAGTPLASDSESNIEAPAKLNNLTGKTTEINNKISTANNNNNNNNNDNTNSNSVIGNGNGNGNGSLSAGGLGILDSLDGENSSSALAADDELTKTKFECSRAEVDDDDARMADDSNSQKMLRTANCDTLKHNKPQKRTHNSCSTADLVNNINDLSDNGLVKSADNSCSQPELKKLRSD